MISLDIHVKMKTRGQELSDQWVRTARGGNDSSVYLRHVRYIHPDRYQLTDN